VAESGRIVEKAIMITGGTVIDENGSRRADVVIERGQITAVGTELTPPKGAKVLDAEGCWVTPGLVDLHTHLREPGGERAETVASGARAAALGGYSAVVAMPNTTPTIDSASVVRDVQHLAEGALVEVAVSGAITVGRLGEQLAAIGDMAALGVRIFTDDGTGVQDAQLMRRALEYASDLGVTLAEHCEDKALANGGHMHEGAWSARLGIAGQPALAEEQMLARDLALVRLTGAPMHFLHLSTAGSVELVRGAKREGLPVTAEATPHHLLLTDAKVAGYDARFKVNPPLRGDADVFAVRAGVADLTIDAIATDHAPHPSEAKSEPFDLAPPGMIGLETALAVANGALVLTGLIEPVALIAAFTSRPAHIAGLAGAGHRGPIEAGAAGNVCVFDPDARWLVDPARMASRSQNSPFSGDELTGKVRHNVVFGEVVVEEGVATR
jgi:dihydroorotase